MFGPSFKSAKCKTQLKLCVSRVKLLRNKREMTVKQMKKEIVELLKDGKEPSATIRVEHILREEATMAAYDVIELFCELLCVRLPIIEANKECPYDLKEAISSIIFAAPRCADLPELQQIRILFTAKYGREFAAAAAELRPDSGVNRRIIEKLSIKAPSGDVKLQLLKDIAAEHNFEWDSTKTETALMEPKQDLLEGYNSLSAQTPPQVFASKSDPPPANPVTVSTPPLNAPQATAPPSASPKLIREESSIPPHLLPGAHDKAEGEQFHPPPSPDTPTYALNHTSPSQDPFGGLPSAIPVARPVSGSPLAPARTPSVDDEELFAPAQQGSESRQGKRRGGEDYADVAEAAAAAAESAACAAQAARAAARLAGSQGGRERQYQGGGERQYQGERERQYKGGKQYRVVDEFGDEKQYEGKQYPEEDRRSENRYQGDSQYRSESQYKSESQYRGEAGRKKEEVCTRQESGSEFSEPRSESGNGSEGDSGRGGNSQPKAVKKSSMVRRYDDTHEEDVGGYAEKGRSQADGRSQFATGGVGSSSNVFEREAPEVKAKYASQDSLTRRFEEYETRGGSEDGDAESEGEQDGYDDEDLDLPGPPRHDPARRDSFKEARSPFDEAPDVGKPRQTGSYIPAGKDGFIFFHDEKRNLKLDEVPPPDTFDVPGRAVLPPPPGHPNRDKVLKATTPKKGNSPVSGHREEPAAFDDPFELPSAPPASEPMDELTARFEALKSRN